MRNIFVIVKVRYFVKIGRRKHTKTKCVCMFKQLSTNVCNTEPVSHHPDSPSLSLSVSHCSTSPYVTQLFGSLCLLFQVELKKERAFKCGKYYDRLPSWFEPNLLSSLPLLASELEHDVCVNDLVTFQRMWALAGDVCCLRGNSTGY